MKSTSGVCRQYIWRESTNSVKNDWSWICCMLEIMLNLFEDRLFLDYYPTKTENPLDHNMIYKAVSSI